MIVGFMALHYGLDFLPYAIESVIDHVSRFYVVYSPEGSHGTRTDVRCPESHNELYQMARAVAGNKLVWHTGYFQHEGQQREMIYQLAPEAEMILVVDSDEVWGPGLFDHAMDALAHRSARFWRVPMVHYWRSFRRAIVNDPSYPVRIICPMESVSERQIPKLHSHQMINHFGYAIRPRLMQYKWLIHGHRAEYRGGWFENVYMNPEQMTDLHPVGSQYWNVETVNPLDYMPGWMQEHPFYEMERIE